ncbi:TonB family C-terminal domain [Fusobacterium necrogenes]|uniref:TonB family C-terminal domain n=1 Tax=Fusobacterium necrogenes TaxID=858 RepID=A0A377GXF0_9FUSO|nr:energy transducer TonB [Fusobacterium necrogenes]STO31241.1 TonB family C-terminal domain [Fusobacterium necrogenes]
MKKDDGISLLLSIVINVIILFLIPALSTNVVENKKIKVGLVAYENKNRTKLDGEKNNNTFQKKTTQEIVKKKLIKQEKPKEEKKEEKPVENKNLIEKKLTGKKIKNEIDMEALNNINSNLSIPQAEILTTPYFKNEYRQIQNLEVPKKEIKTGMLSDVEINENISLTKEIILGENEVLDLKDEERITFNSEIGNDSSFDRILKISGDVEGLPSGYKLGTEDGDIVAKWDNTNKEPIYPETAQLKGLHGSVKIRMNVDENGNIKEVRLERGSGVPEINNAIEEVARTWKIYLSKNGLSVRGSVILEYNFTLKGKVN